MSVVARDSKYKLQSGDLHISVWAAGLPIPNDVDVYRGTGDSLFVVDAHMDNQLYREVHYSEPSQMSKSMDNVDRDRVAAAWLAKFNSTVSSSDYDNVVDTSISRSRALKAIHAVTLTDLDSKRKLEIINTLLEGTE